MTRLAAIFLTAAVLGTWSSAPADAQSPEARGRPEQAGGRRIFRASGRMPLLPRCRGLRMLSLSL